MSSGAMHADASVIASATFEKSEAQTRPCASEELHCYMVCAPTSGKLDCVATSTDFREENCPQQIPYTAYCHNCMCWEAEH